MSTTRESSTETADRYTFGYNSELSGNQETSLSTAKRLRQRLQRQQSGQSGRRYTGESSGASSLVGTPTESGRCFTFTAAQRILRTEERKPSVNQNLSEMLLDAIHMDDVNLVDRLLMSHCNTKVLSSSPSIGSTNTFTDLAQRRHGANVHRRSNASSTISTHSGCKNSSHCTLANTIHLAILHSTLHNSKRGIVELLLKSGYDPNSVALCHCKGNCAASGNVPLSSVLPRTHSSVTPEMCSTCSNLRVTSILDQSPLAVAVKAQSPEMIALLISYGADVNALDEDGNSPLMLAVRESPLNWHVVHMLILFGARISQKNARGICPLDLAPELRKLQETCIENLFQAACSPPSSHGSMAHSGMATTSGDNDLSLNGALSADKSAKVSSVSAPKATRKTHVDAESLLLPASFCERGSLSKAPLSPRTSTAPSISTVSMMESLSVKEKDTRRKSFVSLQLNRRSKAPRESPILDNVSWEQAWECLTKMASNSECIDLILRNILKSCTQIDDSAVSERDAMDSHLGGLLHQILLSSIAEYQQSTPTYQKDSKRKLIGTLVSLVNFCYSCLQKSGSRQFAALACLNKIADAGLVDSLFGTPPVILHSSRLTKRSHDFDDSCPSPVNSSVAEDPPPIVTAINRRQTGESTSGPSLILHSFYRKHGMPSTNVHPVRMGDLYKAFASMQPATVIASLHNAITMQNREAGARSVCSPAHRWRQCHYHCTQILVARLLLFLTSYKEFRQRLCERSQLKSLIQLLEPTLDPQLLCLLLQTVAIIALSPSMHMLLCELQVDEVLIQLILPADDWYYTNHSTKFGHFVKHHAARILVYIGLGDRVGNRVNIFQTFDNITREPTSNLDLRKANVNSPNEDDYIVSTLRTAHFSQEFSKTSMSAEGILLKILQELSKNAIASTSEAITEESPSAICSPAILGISLMNSTGCIMEECEDKSESPIPPLLTLPSRPSTPHSAPPSQTAGPNFQGTSSSLCPPKTTEITSHKPAVPHISADSTAPKSPCAPAPTIVTHNINNIVTANGAAGPSNVINLLCLNNLEAHLAKFSMVIDSILMLRLLLHKLSWDLSLVAKKRITASSANDPHRSSAAVGSSENRAYSSCSLGNSFKNFGKSKSFDRREDQSIRGSKDKRFLRVEQSGSRLSKRVHIRRSSSVEIPRPKRFSSGAKELRKERRKRLGTDTSSGSSKSKKTNSSTSSVHKHLPKYIQSLFRGRMGTDPCRRSHTRGDSSPESVTSGSEAVLEFTKKLQNIPPTRRETMRQAFKNSGQQDSGSTEQKARSMGYTYLPELEVNGASPPRSPATGSNAETAALLGHTTKDCRRPSSPQAIPGLPLIEIRRPSAMSQFEFGYFVNSPEIVGSGPASDSDCAPLLLSGGSGAQISSRKSSDESSMCGWTCSSRASSAMSQRSSSGGLRLSTFSAGTSIASDNSGPFLFSFVLRKRASTIGTRIPLPKRAISRSSGDSLRVPDRESPLQLLCAVEMSPDFSVFRQLLLNLLCIYTNKNSNFVSTLRSCSDVLRQTLNSPQHPQVKNWCTDILAIIGVQLETEESSKFESNERVNDEYLDLQDQIVSGSLPCPKEEAALMAAIQLCVEENWPSNKRTQTIRRHLLKGQFGRIRDLAQKIMVTPWEVDTQLYCTPAHRAYSESTSAFHTAHKVSLAAQQQQSSESRRRRSIAFFTPFFCMSEPDATMSLDVQNSCLPPDLRGDRRTIKLIKERKRKLFHSHIFESEASMKKLYVQTAKRLPAFGCKVFQVKELLHGRTLRKTVRLLCLSSSILCLLDGTSKMVLKRQHAATLNQWRVGGGISKHQLLLEFRGAKWQLIAPSYNVLKSISMTLWEIMQSRASILIQKSFNKSARPSLAFDTQIHSAQSSRTNSYSSTASSFRNSLCCGEPITLFRLELERLQYILHFPEEVAFQLSATEYSLFYAISPIDFIRYVGSDLASIPIAENPSAVRNLVKRLSEVSSWITHVIISQPTHEDRKNCLAAIIRVVDMCWKIGNFNAAVEILMGLKSNKLRPFWLSLKVEERRSYEEFVEILLPNNESAPHALYIEALQRALRMPQCRVIPFFGTFLRDLYAIVNDMPNVVIIGNDGEVEKLSFMQDLNGDDHYSSNIGVGGLLNTDKIGLVGIILDNLETFHKHNKQLMKYVEDSNGGTANPLEDSPEVKPYEPVQPIVGSAHGVTLIPLTTLTFDLDIIQKIQHGTTVIRYEPDTGRSTLCRLVLDASCSMVSWHRIPYGAKESRDKDTIIKTVNLPNIQLSDSSKSTQTSCPNPRPPGSVSAFTNEDGFIRTTFIKAIESVDSYDLDIETIYRRHSVEEMSVPVICWTINFGCMLNDNDFFYFLAPQQIAQYWMSGLQKVVKSIQEQTRHPDRRAMWLKKLYLQLYNECERDSINSEFRRMGPRPVDALHAFGGRVEKWRNLGMSQTISTNPRPTESSSSTEGRAKSRLKQMTIAVTRRVKGASRDCSRSQSPQPQSPLVRPPSIRSQLSSQSGPGPNSPVTETLTGYLLKPRSEAMALSEAGDLDSLYTPSHRSRTPTSSSYGGRSVGGRSIKSWRSRGGETPNSGSMSSGQVCLTGISGKEYQEKPITFTEFCELFRLFSTRMRKDLKDLFNDCVIHSSANSHMPKRCERDKSSPRLQSRLESLTGPTICEFVPGDILTRNTAFHLCHLNEKQHKVFNAMALASINSAGLMDTSRNNVLTPAAIKQFICTQQMEYVDEHYAIKIIQEHEPDPLLRSKQLMSFEGFVRYLSDPTNYAFVPEQIEENPDMLQYPLSYYYICSSHNTYLTGHQLKGESSAEMYRQVMLTGCRCVELDCFDGEDGLPLIYHGHTFTTKISFRQVVDIIKKSAFEKSDLPVILSIENHCSLQQQAKMAQMFKTVFGEKLVSNFLFDADYSDNPRLPSPWQLKNKIMIKNKKMVAEPSAGPIYYIDKISNIGDSGDRTLRHKQSRSSYDSSTSIEDDLDEFSEEDAETDDGDADLERTDADSQKGIPAIKTSARRSSKDSECSFVSDRTSTIRQERKQHNDIPPLDLKGDDEMFSTSGYSTHSPKRESKRGIAIATKKAPTSHQIALELSDLVIYSQAVKFKGFIFEVLSSYENTELRPYAYSQSSNTTPRMRSQAPSMLSSGPPRRPKSSSQISTDSIKSNDDGSHHTTSQQMSLSPAAATVSPTSTGNNTARPHPNSGASCYQVSSLPESMARKLCRRHPQKCMAYTRDHIMRTYPGGMRIDSSNFNPHRLVEFWQCGLQMVALNYQTPDVAMAVNSAMFEQSGNCGYTLKPRVLWDPTHPLYGRLNPAIKEPSGGGSALILMLTIISGQYVSPGTFQASPFLEVEVIGVPGDSAKDKSKIIGRNSVNPTWTFSTTFRINFAELAFLRIAVCDGAANGRVLSQRVVPVRCIRPGYRHLPLRSPANQPLEQATIFMRTRFEQEEHIYLYDEDSNNCTANYEPELAYQILKVDPEANVKPLSLLRRQIFVLRIIGLYMDETQFVTVHAESGSIVRNIIQNALVNAGKGSESAEDYVLLEESVLCSTPSPVCDSSIAGTSSGMESLGLCLESPSQRILPHNEPILDAVACWNGSTRRFILRKKSADPAGRSAWITSIIKSGGSGATPGAAITNISAAAANNASGNASIGSSISTSASPSFSQTRRGPNLTDSIATKSHSSTQLHGRSLDAEVIEPSHFLDPSGMHPRAKSMGESFLVCIHNISDNHPYAILRTSINNTAKDIIKQIFAKTQRYDVNEDDYVLIEELRETASCSEPSTSRNFEATSAHTSISVPKAKYRALNAEENIWKVQSRWTGSGRFLLDRRDNKIGRHHKVEVCSTPSAGLPTPANASQISTPRKISLSNTLSTSFGLSRRISRFGKSLTLDSAGKNREN